MRSTDEKRLASMDKPVIERQRTRGTACVVLNNYNS